MGLFSSSYETVIGTSVLRVIEDKNLPNSPKTALTKALLQDQDIVENLLEELTNSVGVRANRMYDYAANGKYSFGLPTGEIVGATQGAAEVERVLKSLYGDDIVITYTRFGRANLLHTAWMEVSNQLGWDSTSNILANVPYQASWPEVLKPGNYLNGIQITLPTAIYDNCDASQLELWGLPPGTGPQPSTSQYGTVLNNSAAPKPVIRSTVTTPIITVTYSQLYRRPIRGSEIISGSRILTLPMYPSDKDYYMVEYLLNGERKFWMYEYGSGGHPSLDVVFDQTESTAGEFFPQVYFRWQKQRMDEVADPIAIKTSKRMCKFLGMDYLDVVDAVHENPDIEDVENALMIMAVPANSEDPTDIEYLFHHFDHLRLIMPPNRTLAQLTYVDGQLGVKYSYDAAVGQTIQDLSGFKMIVSHTGIYKRLVAGTLGAVGTFHKDYKAERSPNWNTGPIALPLYDSVHIYRKQTSQVMYEEIQVRNLSIRYYVYGSHNTMGKDNIDYLLVPVDSIVTDKMNILNKEKLYARSLHYVFNSHLEVKVKWYEQEWFGAFLTVVAIIITAVSFGQGAPLLGATTGVASLTFQQILIQIFVYAIKQLIMTIALKLFVKLVGPKVAMLAAVVALIYGGYKALTTQGGLANAPWAKELLTASNGLINQSGNYYAQQLVGLQEDYEELQAEKDRVSELISQAQDLLAHDNILSPFTIIGESPSDYYQRTMHTRSVAKHVTQLPKYFVSNALRLPTVAETLQGTFNYGISI